MATGIVTQVPQPTTDFVPEVFGRLTTLDSGYFVPRSRQRRKYHRVRCQCGSELQVRRDCLVSGNTQSCGCWSKEKAIETHTKHGHSNGGKKSAEYAAYLGMLARCYNPKHIQYKDWGGRGIGVWDTWRGPGGFELWFAEIGPKPSPELTLERKDVNKNYEPGNICWATWEEQANNKRNSRLVTYEGRTQTLSQWTKELGVNRTLLEGRLRLGWSIEDAMTLPVGKGKQNRRHDLDNRD